MRLREKFPELVLEAAMVVFAVVVALGLEEWREERERYELADRAMGAVLEEIESNIGELDDARERNRELLNAIIAADEAQELPGDFDLVYEYSLLSTSAWETAQMTQATQYMPLGRVQELARLYGLQDLFERSQDEVLDIVLSIGRVARDDPNSIPSHLLGPVANAMGMESALMAAYDTLRVRFEREEGR